MGCVFLGLLLAMWCLDDEVWSRVADKHDVALDNTALGALSTLSRMGLSVPEDISLVGYNDIPIVSSLPTPLTSVRVPFDQIATSALELLGSDDRMKQDRLRVATPSLIPRKSTAAPLTQGE